MPSNAYSQDQKRKRPSTDNSAQHPDAKRVKSEEIESKPKDKATKALSIPENPSNTELTPDIVKKLAIGSKKPFPNPQNQAQVVANQKWKKQQLYRKMQGRTQTKKLEGSAKKGTPSSPADPTHGSGESDEEEEEEEEEDADSDAEGDAATKPTGKHQKKPESKNREEHERRRQKRKEKRAERAAQKLKDIESGVRDESERNKTKKGKSDGGDTQAQVVRAEQPTEVSKKEKREKKDKRSKKTKVKDDLDDFGISKALTAQRTVVNRGSWNMSKPSGGRFINHDPVFSLDESFLFLATSREVHVYSTAESLLVRTLPVPQTITYTLSASKPNLLYIATASGNILLFDWTNGKQIRESSGTKAIRAIAVVKIPGTKNDTLFAVENEYSEGVIKDHITVRNFSTPSVSLFWVPLQTLHHLKVLDNGRTIFASSETQLAIGTLSGADLDASVELSELPSRYVWRTLKATEPVTCLDAQVRSQSSSGTSKKQRLIFDLVLGNVKGEVIVYEDILFKLEENEKLKGKDTFLKPIVYHWHREAPATVKWSLDGNYVISGGKETVLCLWQRETSKRQLLPHLTSAIESLSVSPKGISYAVRLADNSVMILSTSELQPKTNIAGLQSRFVPDSQTSIISDIVHDPLDSFIRTPAVGNPRNSKQLLMAVPASQSPEDNNPPAPFLQTFDVFTSRHVSRQALTRNMVTSSNTGPENNKLREPNVTLLEVSFDGQWLATVEEWSPPTADIIHTAPDDETLSLESKRRRETYLKFWRRNDEEEGYWALDTRIDFPHQSSSDTYANRIFSLVSNPAELSFATVGEDGIVRVWKPKTRLVDGRVVRGAKVNGVVVTWTSALAIELENSAISLEDCTAFISGKLAYSNDGSMLAATTENADDSCANVIHFLDTSNGSIRFSESNVYTSHLLGMGFVNRYFIVLSDELRVWDMVSNKLVFGFRLDTPNLAPKHKGAMSYLAVNKASNTFAIAVPNKPTSLVDGMDAVETIMLTGLETSVIVFDPRELAPLFAVEVPGVVSALTAVQGGAGYIVLDASAEVRVLAPKVAAGVSALVKDIDGDFTALNIENDNVEMEDDEDEEIFEEEDEEVEVAEFNEGDLANGDKPVVRTEHLEKLFEGSRGVALPAVRDLFYDVVGLYSRKKDEDATV